MNIWVLIKITDHNGILTVDPQGVYSDANVALEWIEKLEKLSTDKLNSCFDALDFQTDVDPICFDKMKNDREQLIDTVNDTLQALLRKEYIEAFVEEDGRFSYELTKKGRTIMKGIPGQKIEKFLRENT